MAAPMKVSEREAIRDLLWEGHEVGVPFPIQFKKTQASLGVGQKVFMATITSLRDAGALEWEYKQSAPTMFTLLVPHDEARRVEMRRQFKYARKEPVAPSAVAVTDDEDEEVKAVAGPERPREMAALAPLRRDEGRASVEAARQYRDRAKVVESTIRSLSEQGITVNPSAFRYERQPALEAVAEVLPYVEQLERSVERLASENGALRAKCSETDALRRDVRALREQNQRLIAERVASRMERSA